MRYFPSLTPIPGARKKEEPCHLCLWIDYPFAEAARKNIHVTLNQIEGITFSNVSASLTSLPGTTIINLRRGSEFTWKTLLPTVIAALTTNLEVSTSPRKLPALPSPK